MCGQVGLRRGKLLIEVRDRLALTQMGGAVDHERQHVAAPALRQRLTHIPETRGQVLDLLHQKDIDGPRAIGQPAVAQLPGSWSADNFATSRWRNRGGDLRVILAFDCPSAGGWRQLGNHRLPNCSQVWILAVKLSHQLDVPLGEPFHLRQFVVKVACQPRNHAGAPALTLLLLGDDSADVPIEADQFGIGGERGPNLGGADALLDIREKRRIVRRHIGPVHAITVCLFAGHDRSIPRVGKVTGMRKKRSGEQQQSQACRHGSSIDPNAYGSNQSPGHPECSLLRMTRTIPKALEAATRSGYLCDYSATLAATRSPTSVVE